MQKIILITPTHLRKERMGYLKELSGIFSQVENLLWLVCEDGIRKHDNVEELLQRSGIDYKYFNYGPTNNWGECQRDFLCEYVFRHDINGVCYFADDDNWWDIKIFDEIRKTKRVGVFPVGNRGPSNIETPIIVNGKVSSWDAHLLTRKYPLDMGGFSFHSNMLTNISNKRFFPLAGNGWGETRFLESIISDKRELEPLCNYCTDCYVFWGGLKNSTYDDISKTPRKI